MTIIRSKVSQDYTVVVNRVTEDKEFSSKYIGVFLRLISKGSKWEISADGLAALYPTEGREFYRNALKHMCKLGYLLRIPQQRENGKFTKAVMELYDYRVIETTLTDEQVEDLFSLGGMDTEEIQKIYPQRVSQCGSSRADLQTQESIKQEKNNKLAGPSSPLSDQWDVPNPGTRVFLHQERNETIYKENNKLAGSSSSDNKKKESESQSNLFPQKKAVLENSGYPLTSDNIYNLSKNHTLQDIEKAVALLKTKKEEIKSPSSWISRCIREKWWETADQELITTTSLWDSFKTAISDLQAKISFNMSLDVSKDEVSFSSKERAFIVISSRFSTEDLTKQTLEVINKSLNESHKLIYVNLGTPKIEVMQ